MLLLNEWQTFRFKMLINPLNLVKIHGDIIFKQQLLIRIPLTSLYFYADKLW